MTIPDGAGVKVTRKEFPPEVLEDYDAFVRNATWYDRNLPTLRRTHPDRLVAVHNGGVIAVSETLDGLLNALNGMDVPNLRQVFIRYVWSADTIVIPRFLFGRSQG